MLLSTITSLSLHEFTIIYIYTVLSVGTECGSMDIWTWYLLIMEYGSTPYVGLTRKKHGRHTLAQILFSSEN